MQWDKNRMTWHHNTLYRVLFYICMIVFLCLAGLSVFTVIDTVWRITLLIIGLFIFIIACSYFQLSVEENKQM